jgi:hypothetical protein
MSVSFKMFFKVSNSFSHLPAEVLTLALSACRRSFSGGASFSVSARHAGRFAETLRSLPCEISLQDFCFAKISQGLRLKIVVTQPPGSN